MPSKHWRLSPSSMSRILKCPASAVESTEDTGSVYADEGTEAHEKCERSLQGLQVDFAGNREMEQAVHQFVDYVRAHLSQFPNSELHIEKQLQSVELEDFGGTMDALIVSPAHLHVIDFKYGKRAVHSSDNKQGLSYLSLANEHFPGRKRFFFSIVQPRVFTNPQCDEYTLDDLESHAFDVMMVADDKTYNPGEQCSYYCPLLRTCKAREEWMMSMVRDALEDDGDWDGEKCKEILTLQPVVSKLVEQAEDRLRDLMLNGTPVAGWRLGRSLGNRTWRNEEEIWLAIEMGEFPREAFVREKLATPAQLEGFSKAYTKFVADNSYRPELGCKAVREDSKLPLYDPMSLLEELDM